jgi:hypothetical protein
MSQILPVGCGEHDVNPVEFGRLSEKTENMLLVRKSL